MLSFSRKGSFIAITSVLLLIGFSAISLISYYVANSTLNQHIRTNTLPITSDNIYSEVQRDLLQPILVSSLMAQDTFVHDWIVAGEQNPAAITRYLNNIQERYQTITAFFISESTRNYYHSSGILKKVDPENPQDDWYFRVKKLSGQYEINMDIDTADNSRTTFFVNHKVLDRDNSYLGVIGVGLASEAIKDMIDVYQNRYNRQVYFVDRQGKITLHGEALDDRNSIREIDGLKEIATQILTTTGGSYEYQFKDKHIFLKTRYVPDLDWYLLVEQEEHPEQAVQSVLWLNLGLSIGITIIVLILAHFTLGSYQRRLEQMANTDKLTGAITRSAFEPTFEQLLSFAQRRQQPLSVLLMDIDHFKVINDTHGHLLGDHVLKHITKLMNSLLRKSDVICRWGGEEFLIVLPECNLHSATNIASKMRKLIEESLKVVDSKHIDVTASFGVAQFNNLESSENLFLRVDKALYAAKAGGRNCVETTEQEQEASAKA
ncbi:sensor domain-containing diguanylate cyclase [Maricurvus nonylphenolicus]|uniref:sensor domain-containing diguanylate cyclase n=1 Tax=Maricurvus nonylphenolicus TaxID=1008307 RepID=UPI0036F1B50C